MKLRIRFFCHSLVSDWNHGNAHFLRGVMSELVARGHDVQAFEPENGWSLTNLIREAGAESVHEFQSRFPLLKSSFYSEQQFQPEEFLDGVDVVLVHEWTAPAVVNKIGQYRRRNSSIRAFFHDTHHRAITAPQELSRNDLSGYDGLLVYGNALREVYFQRGWGNRVHVWHEAADTRIFHPIEGVKPDRDLVWIGNWGDEERTQELNEYLIEPAGKLGVSGAAYGVRYPAEAVEHLTQAGLQYGGWTPNYRVPEIFAHSRVTVHVPRRPYAAALPGIPTIRPFEALACGIPLISAPWPDVEGLFDVGGDFLMARNGEHMASLLKQILYDADFARELSSHGRNTVLKRHTCAHRVDQLLNIYKAIQPAKMEAAVGVN
jgi:spore maturation protein CgeB